MKDGKILHVVLNYIFTKFAHSREKEEEEALEMARRSQQEHDRRQQIEAEKLAAAKERERKKEQERRKREAVGLLSHMMIKHYRSLSMFYLMLVKFGNINLEQYKLHARNSYCKIVICYFNDEKK